MSGDFDPNLVYNGVGGWHAPDARPTPILEIGVETANQILAEHAVRDVVETLKGALACPEHSAGTRAMCRNCREYQQGQELIEKAYRRGYGR